ncbi:uncharacterized protein LOC123538564 [Mercenaria mercenaria]|uniref:uncharacterized protein LOC123538564 n=1 Tax=Mercenaria mercenaria TaxID=6596 RepID=UPI00234EA0CD|nr:uncharacterized protein LOC123538564 [Mercenaria mercenaria]
MTSLQTSKAAQPGGGVGGGGERGELSWTKPNTDNGEASVTVLESVATVTSTGIELEVSGATGTVTYTITDQPNQNQFGIGDGTNSKVISLATGTLDYDTSPIPSYVVTVEAVEGGTANTATVTITINIGDVNDISPVFAETTYQFTIPDGSDIGTTLGMVTATDNDGTQANNVIDSYDFTAGNTNEDFAVSDAGQITMAKAIDKARTASYELIITATDSGNPAMTGTTTVSVTVGEDEGNGEGGDNGNGGSTGGGDGGGGDNGNGGDTGGGDNGNGGGTGGGDGGDGDNGNGGGTGGGDGGGGDNGNGGDTGGGDGNDGGNGDGGDNGKSGATAVFANIVFVLLTDFIVVVLIGV